MMDLIVVGAGSAGYSAALHATRLGLSVALIEEDQLGGTCLHRGCVPTKSWLHSAQLRRVVGSAAEFGITTTAVGISAQTIRDQADFVVGQLHRGLRQLLTSSAVRIISGRATLSGPASVHVAGEILQAKAVLIATGAHPATLGLPVDGERIITSDHALRLTRLPERAVVVGGGVIGVEFASLWTDLGVQVVLVEAANQLLPGTDPALSKLLERQLASRGVQVKTATKLGEIASDDKGVHIDLDEGELDAEVVLLAVGRKPTIDGLGLAELGVKTSDGWIDTDDSLRSSVDSIYAAGDVVRGAQLAHRGYAHGRFVAEHLAWRLGKGKPPTKLPADHTIPSVVYSSPQLATVGLSVDQAGVGATETVYHLAGNAKALIARPKGQREIGLVKVVTDASGSVVGIHIIGEEIADLITSATMHVGWHTHPEDIVDIAHPHPTLSESLAEAILGAAGKALHMRG